MEWILTQYATAMAGIIQVILIIRFDGLLLPFKDINFNQKVNINPAYKPYELEYSLNKVGCKAIIMSETFKSQNYAKMFSEICPEIDKCKPGELKSKKVPELRSAILISNNHNLG